MKPLLGFLVYHIGFWRLNMIMNYESMKDLMSRKSLMAKKIREQGELIDYLLCYLMSEVQP